MVIYYILLGVISFFLVTASLIPDKITRYALLLESIFIMILFSSLRVNIGLDYIGHYAHYYMIAMGKYNLKLLIEPIYSLINYLCFITHLGYNGVIVIMSLITIFPFYLIAKDNNIPCLLLLFFCLLYLISYCLIRQMAAISIAFYGSYKYKYDNDKKKGMAFLICAAGIHFSLWLYFVCFYACQYIKVSYLVSIILSFLLFLIGFKTDFFTILIKFLSKGTIYEYYFKNLQEASFGTGIGVLLRFITYFMLFYLEYAFSNERKSSYFSMFIILIVIDSISLRVQIFTRLRFIFMPCVFLPLITYSRNRIPFPLQKYKISSLFIILILAISALLFASTAFVWGNVPYQSLLFHSLDYSRFKFLYK